MAQVFADPGVRLKLLMLVLFLWIAYREIKAILFGLWSRRWHRTPAVVITSGIDRESGVYYPKVIYRYQANGRDHTDDRITYAGRLIHSKSHAVDLSAENPVGKEITVFVDPRKPSRSVLIPGVHWTAFINLVFFTLMFGGIAFIGEILNFIWPGCQPNCPKP